MAKLWIDDKWFHDEFGSKMESYQLERVLFVSKWRPVAIPVHSFVFRPGSSLSIDCTTQFLLSGLPVRALGASSNSDVRTFNNSDITARTTEVVCDYTITDMGTTLVNLITLSF